MVLRALCKATTSVDDDGMRVLESVIENLPKNSSTKCEYRNDLVFRNGQVKLRLSLQSKWGTLSTLF